MADNIYEQQEQIIQEQIDALKVASWSGVDFNADLFEESKITSAIVPSIVSYINSHGPITIQVDDEKKFLLNNKTDTDPENKYNFSLDLVSNFVEKEEYAEQFIINEAEELIDNEVDVNADFEAWSDAGELEGQIPNPTINSEEDIGAWVREGKNEGWFLEAGTLTKGSYSDENKSSETYDEENDGNFYVKLSNEGKLSYIFPYYSTKRKYSLTGKYSGTGKITLYCYNQDDTLSNKYVKSNLLKETILTSITNWKTFSGFDFQITDTDLSNVTSTSTEPDYYCILTFETTSPEKELCLDTLFLAYSDDDIVQPASVENPIEPATVGETTLAELKEDLEQAKNERINENQKEWYNLIYNLLQWIKEFGKITVQTVNSGSYDIAEDSNYGIDFTTYVSDITYLPETSAEKEIDITYTKGDFLNDTYPKKIKIDQICNFVLQPNSKYDKLTNFTVKIITEQTTGETTITDITDMVYLGDNKFSIPPVGENATEIQIDFDVESVVFDVNVIQIADKSIESTVVVGDDFTTEEYEEDVEEDLTVDDSISTDDTEQETEDAELEDFDVAVDIEDNEQDIVFVPGEDDED